MTKRTTLLPPGVRRLFRLPPSRDRVREDLDEELRAHLAMRVDELIALGWSAADAETEAARRFGDSNEYRAYTERLAERRARRAGIVRWIDEWMQDVRFGFRQFRKLPGFTTLAIVTLAFGIGANTAIFTVVHALLIAPLPYPNGNRIVLVGVESDDRFSMGPGAAVIQAWRTRARSLQAIASVSVDAMMTQQAGEIDTIAAFITPSYFDVLGVQPELGRRLTEDDARAGAAPVAMITDGLWRRRFGARADVLGKTVTADEHTYTIVGVTPPEMGVPMTRGTSLRVPATKLHEATPSIWVPEDPRRMGGRLFARLRPGVSPDQASHELQSIAVSVPLTPAYVKRFGPARHCCARVWRAQDLVDPREARTVEVLFVAVGVLLLIACANVANLLMARAWSRRREFAVRVAMGAGRTRLFRLVLTEGVLLALGGGVAGLALAWQTLRVIIALRPPSLDNLAATRLDPAVLLWSLAISVTTGLIFGAAPAFFAGDRSLATTLRSEGYTGSRDDASRRVRAALIIGEIALSLVLLVGAGLLVRSFVELQHMPLGFDPHGLVSLDVLLPGPRDLPSEARAAFSTSLLERLRGLPGVTEAAIGTMPGLAYIAGDDVLETADGSRAIKSYATTFITPNYFRVARMTVLEGRAPDSLRWRPLRSFADAGARSTTRTPTELLINQTLAHQLFPNGDALGARLDDGAANPEARQYSTVIGIVADVHMPGSGSAPEPNVYQPPVPIELPLLARVSGSPQSVIAAMRRAVHGAHAHTVLQTVITGDQYLSDALAPTRFAMALLAAFSLIAVLLSAVGLYGVIAYSVTQRTREIGIRVALGAEPASIAGLVVGSGLRLATVGIVAGAAAALVATRTLSSMLYGVSTNDPLTFAVITLGVAGVAVLASYVPARRALRIDPVDALRAE
ncbi:MAG TPA: ABC transporter permease [Gemmatimonadaceae bacterium]|nr:ABC transporter permease [Gemmatimonadaceae bacterium]